MNEAQISGFEPSVHTRALREVGAKVTDALDLTGTIVTNLRERVEQLEKIVRPGPRPKPPGPGPQPGPDDSAYLLEQKERFYGNILIARHEGDYERAVALLGELRNASVDDPKFQMPVFHCVKGATEIMANWLGEGLESLWEAIDPDVPDAVARVTMRNMAYASMRIGCHEEALQYADGYVAPQELSHLGITTLFN